MTRLEAEDGIMNWKNIVDTVYSNNALRRLLRFRPYLLQKELQDCASLLDLGCGPASVAKFVTVQWSVGVELHAPYIRKTASKRIHDQYILADVRNARFRDKCFDCVLASDVIEHLPKDEGYGLIERMEEIARKKVIVTTTNGFIKTDAIDGNSLQIHKSGWNATELAELGFKVWGLTGLKYLRDRRKLPSHGDVLETLRFRPRPIWLLIAEATELVTWHIPETSFELFCVKTMN